jgi:DNA-binding FadR family transcriptional regulator
VNKAEFDLVLRFYKQFKELRTRIESKAAVITAEDNRRELEARIAAARIAEARIAEEAARAKPKKEKRTCDSRSCW